jgi:hypothetical protein
MRAAYVTTTRSPRATDVRSTVAEKVRVEDEEEEEEKDFLEKEEGEAAALAPAALADDAAGGPSSPFKEKTPNPDANSKVVRPSATTREGAKRILFIFPPPCAFRAP